MMQQVFATISTTVFFISLLASGVAAAQADNTTAGTAEDEQSTANTDIISTDRQASDEKTVPSTTDASPKTTDESEAATEPASPNDDREVSTISSSTPPGSVHKQNAPPAEGPLQKTPKQIEKPDSAHPANPTLPVTSNPFIALGDEMFLGITLITAWGSYFWDWWETSFHFKREHGFTHDSSTGGADKTGHFLTAYIFADFLNWRLRKQGWSPLRSALVGSSVAMGLMTWIEVGDATSEYGWSWEDMLADFLGVAISAGLAISPVADELFDFRLEYWPTSSYLDGGVMAADYSGMKYLMALRMTGIKPLKKTPLRFIEWHLGFYSRGFRSFDHTRSTNRVLYVGMGIDLREVFDLFIPKKYKRPFDVAFTYYQVPYTSWTMKKWNHYWQEPVPQYRSYSPQTEK